MCAEASAAEESRELLPQRFADTKLMPKLADSLGISVEEAYRTRLACQNGSLGCETYAELQLKAAIAGWPSCMLPNAAEFARQADCFTFSRKVI